MTGTLDDLVENAVCQIQLHDLKRLVPILAFRCGRGGFKESEALVGDVEWGHDGGDGRVLLRAVVG